jgi:hypothetical protein
LFRISSRASDLHPPHRRRILPVSYKSNAILEKIQAISGTCSSHTPSPKSLLIRWLVSIGVNPFSRIFLASIQPIERYSLGFSPNGLDNCDSVQRLTASLRTKIRRTWLLPWRTYRLTIRLGFGIILSVPSKSVAARPWSIPMCGMVTELRLGAELRGNGSLPDAGSG